MRLTSTSLNNITSDTQLHSGRSRMTRGLMRFLVKDLQEFRKDASRGSPRITKIESIRKIVICARGEHSMILAIILDDITLSNDSRIDNPGTVSSF